MFNKTKSTTTPTTTPTAIKDDSKFRLCAKAIFLTYPGHLTDENITTILSICEKCTVDEWLACHETGESGYQHTHIGVWMMKKFETRNARIFDIEDKHPNVSGVRNKNATVAYIMKDGNHWGSMDADQYKEKHIPIRIERIQKAETLTDAYKTCNNMSEILPTKHIYEAKCKGIQDEVIEKYSKMHPIGWQKDLWDRLLTKPDDRTIRWWWDEKGNSGKTTFMRMFTCMHEREVISIMAINRVSDTMDLIRNHIESGNVMKYVFINLSRQAEGREQIYEIIEKIKDGWITTTKYKGNTLMYSSPHVTVFANFAPDVRKISIDRWQINEIYGSECPNQAGSPVTLLGAPKGEEGSWMA